MLHFHLPHLRISELSCMSDFRLAFTDRQLGCVCRRLAFWLTASGLGNTPLTSGKLDSCPTALALHPQCNMWFWGGVRQHLLLQRNLLHQSVTLGFHYAIEFNLFWNVISHRLIDLSQHCKKEIWNTAAVKLRDSREVLRGVQISHAREREIFVHTHHIVLIFSVWQKYREEIVWILHIAKWETVWSHVVVIRWQLSSS